MRTPAVLQPEIKNSLVYFERFLQTVGFKRIEGSVYGLLILTPQPVTLAEIHEQLGISQGAASQALKALSQWGAVDSQWEPEKRAQVHQASEDSLKIVTTVFKKREQMAIAEFKAKAQNALDTFARMGDSPQTARARRLKSIVVTCEVAEAVIAFVDSLSQLGSLRHYQAVVHGLPKTLEAIVLAAKSSKILASKIENRIRTFRKLGTI